jgi:PP-loop superfamily ATP-utilizing enzyme
VLEFKRQILTEHIKQQKEFTGQAVKKIKNGEEYVRELEQTEEIEQLQQLNSGIV